MTVEIEIPPDRLELNISFFQGKVFPTKNALEIKRPIMLTSMVYKSEGHEKM